jgi:hypothetical protein
VNRLTGPSCFAFGGRHCAENLISVDQLIRPYNFDAIVTIATENGS